MTDGSSRCSLAGGIHVEGTAKAQRHGVVASLFALLVVPLDFTGTELSYVLNLCLCEVSKSPADRQEVSAHGEDVAVVTVEVQDGRGRVLPMTDNVVKFRVSGAGKLIGTGNGDPIDHESDKETVHKAFCGYCMAIVQSTKEAGSITVGAESPGLASASVTIAANEVRLRPQVPVWKREV